MPCECDALFIIELFLVSILRDRFYGEKLNYYKGSIAVGDDDLHAV